jgi:hypothetical protein
MEPKVQFCTSSELAALPIVGTTNCLAAAALDIPTNRPENTVQPSQNFGLNQITTRFHRRAKFFFGKASFGSNPIRPIISKLSRGSLCEVLPFCPAAYIARDPLCPTASPGSSSRRASLLSPCRPQSSHDR